MAANRPEAYCTLLVSDDYLPGAMVLAHSLRDNGTQKPLVVLVTLESVSAATIEQLKTVYDQIIPVDRIINKSPANLYLMDRPDLISVFTKICLWKQTQFKKIVYIDADVVALRAPDELFERASPFAAAPDVGWPDCFNSGVMALTPNMGDYYALLTMAQRGISFDGADQGLLNMHFNNWDRISFTYNCTPSGHYQYVPAYRHFQSSISMIHFIGRDKPWTTGRDTGGHAGVYDELVGRWWAVYDRHFRGATYKYVPDQGQVPNWTVQQYVAGEPRNSEFLYGPPRPTLIFTPPGYHPPETPAVDAGGMLEPDEMADSIRKDEYIPVPTAEQRRFSAPQSEWDPMKQEPPVNSRPEAANFPRHTYTMSEDRSLYKPPTAYPEPPRDMYYEVPKTPPQQPKPIFPWEATQAKPTRVFAEEPPPPPTAPPAKPAPIDTTATATEKSTQSPTTPTIQVTPSESFGTYSRANAWDEDPNIGRYMSRFRFGRRANVQVIHQSSDVTSPDTKEEEESAERRPSLKLTDFPTEVERPSLPVTPAPVRRGVYWGEERDSISDLPGADGVPTQQDWNPLKKLEELQRRQSEVLEQGPRRPSQDVPQRSLPKSATALPESATLLPTSEEEIVPPSSVSTRKDQPVDLDAEKSGADEGVFDAT